MNSSICRIPILTYHALHAPGWGYGSNDHVALEQDLQTVRAMGFRVAPLSMIADAVIAGSVSELAARRVVGISFDDGTDHDFLDFSHPGYGHLKSMARVLREGASDLGLSGDQAQATSFVIASPDARAQLDRACIAGREQWRDEWWLAAAREGVLAIANHSWDHLHPALDSVVAAAAQRGRFDSVIDIRDADQEIGDAEKFLRKRLGNLANGLFAYPYGQYSDYLISSYFPEQDLVRAAFACGGEYVSATTKRWTIPRFTCGEHWRAPDEFGEILALA